MRLRAWLVLSVGLNLALGGLLILVRSPLAPQAEVAKPSGTSAVTNLGKTHVVVRRQFFDWNQIESADYPSYISNLHSINCPEATIRDIIVADVNQLYTEKRLNEGLVFSQTEDPDLEPEEFQAKVDRFLALETERRALLTRLLGEGWEKRLLAAPTPIPAAITNLVAIDFSQGSLAELSAEQRRLVQSICNRAARTQAAYLRHQQEKNLPVDASEVARLRQNTRTELAQILSPAQQEDFLVRYSSTAERLRAQFNGFQVTSEEFRKLFRVCDPYDQQMELNYATTDPATLKKRAELERQREAVIKRALGSKRYTAYQVLNDPAFKDAQAAVQKDGGSADAVVPVYQVKEIAAAEKQRIQNDPTLTPEQREQALRNVRVEQRVAEEEVLERTTAPPLPPQ